MSINQFERLHSLGFEPIMYVLKIRRYQLIILGSGTFYALVYVFAVGVISYYPGLSLLKVTAPIVNANSLGVMIIPASYIYIFIFYYAIAFLGVSSFLVGLNIALMIYSRNTSKSCILTNIGSRGIFGMLPAFFTSFACCGGGGLMALVIGPTAFSLLALYSGFMAPLTVALLAAGTIFMSTKISKSYRLVLNHSECRRGGTV